nr:endonuclease/exonuclease/phosphatase family protein [Azospirillum sp. SYSU D00513]
MVRGVQRLRPDLLMLQESLLCPELGLDTAGHLARFTGMEVVQLPLRRKPRAVEGRRADSWSGLAVLSRRPVLSSRRIDLPSDPRDGERAALLVEIDLAGRRLLAVNLHLTHLRDGGDLRRAQLAAIVAELRAAGLADAVLLAGDFNTGPDLLRLEELGLTDCRARLGLPAATTMADGGLESGDTACPAPSCLDHVLAGPGSALRPVRLLTDLHASPSEGLPAASDHLAVVLDFEMGSPLHAPRCRPRLRRTTCLRRTTY